jgi:DNA-binding response OmpR family regulator
MPKVILIEDDPTMRSLLKTLFEMESYEVLTLAEDLNVIPILEAENPDLIMIDVHLNGDEEGIDLLRLIRRNEILKTVAVLMASGMDYSHTCLEEGADGFILKPFMPDDLLVEVRKLLVDH